MKIKIEFNSGKEFFQEKITEEQAESVMKWLTKVVKPTQASTETPKKRKRTTGVKRTHWTQEEDAHIFSQYEHGVPAKIIGKQLNRTEAAVVQRKFNIMRLAKKNAKTIAKNLFGGQARVEA